MRLRSLTSMATCVALSCAAPVRNRSAGVPVSVSTVIRSAYEVAFARVGRAEDDLSRSSDPGTKRDRRAELAFALRELAGVEILSERARDDRRRAVELLGIVLSERQPLRELHELFAAHCLYRELGDFANARRVAHTIIQWHPFTHEAAGSMISFADYFAQHDAPRPTLPARQFYVPVLDYAVETPYIAYARYRLGWMDYLDGNDAAAIEGLLHAAAEARTRYRSERLAASALADAALPFARTLASQDLAAAREVIRFLVEHGANDETVVDAIDRLSRRDASFTHNLFDALLDWHPTDPRVRSWREARDGDPSVAEVIGPAMDAPDPAWCH